MPDVSVVIPVYNTAPWLEECLDSVLQQSFTDLEIICINDASTDNSADILEKKSEKDKRINIITLNNNTGLSHARNTGMDFAHGKYIYFLDSDDKIMPNAIDLMYHACEDGELDILYFDSGVEYESDEYKRNHEIFIINRDRDEYRGVFSGKELLVRFHQYDEWRSSIPMQFYRKNFLINNTIRFYEGILHEDDLFAMQAAFAAKKVRHIPEKLFIRRYRANSIVTSKTSAKNFSGIFCSVYYINQETHKNHLYDTKIRNYIARLNNRAIRLYEKHQPDILPELERLHNQELLTAYYQFEAQQDTYCSYGEFSAEDIRKIQQYELVYIYGAGIAAKSVCAGLIKNQIPIDGFIVSEGQNHPKTLEGHRIHEASILADIEKKGKSIVIIAIKGNTQQIAERLRSMNIDYLYPELIKPSNRTQ